MRVLVCGSRTFSDRSAVYAMLDGIRVGIGDDPEMVIVEGEADGADTLGREWAECWLQPFEPFPADWTVHDATPEKAIGRRKDGTPYNRWAGPQRNARMLEEGKPDMCVAFIDKPLSDSRGTKDMVGRCRGAKVKTIVVWVPA